MLTKSNIGLVTKPLLIVKECCCLSHCLVPFPSWAPPAPRPGHSNAGFIMPKYHFLMSLQVSGVFTILILVSLLSGVITFSTTVITIGLHMIK